MKDFKKNYGWHVKLVGGPAWSARTVKGERVLENHSWLRSWNGHADPQEEANALLKRITIDGNYDGWYEKEAARKADGSLKEIKHKGIVMIAWQYVWKEKASVAS